MAQELKDDGDRPLKAVPSATDAPAAAQSAKIAAVTPGAAPRVDAPSPEDPGTPKAPAPRAKPTQRIAPRARMRPRHYGLVAMFFLCVGLPAAATTYYLYWIAKDQYASHVGFAVRTEDVSSPIELLGGITELSGSSSSDTDILYEFIQSQAMVRTIDEKLDLRRIYVLEDDPVFSLAPGASIEALTDYWRRMVKVFYDSAGGLIEIRVTAFTPEDANAVSTAIYEESSRMINALSASARADATRYANEELERAVERRKEAQQAMTAFRIRTQIVDPTTDAEGRTGLLASLEAELARARIDLDLLLTTTSSPGDPRIGQARRLVEVIEARIQAEKDQLSASGNGDTEAYSMLVSEYESLAVDQEFAQQSYVTALAAYDAARAEAQRQTRYLTSYIPPTLAETSQFPKRGLLLSLVIGGALVSWAILMLVFYSLRDRK
ncbi:sugar transporter [Aestuariibius sp. 2305UL40-4]|uniref:sugar transporter n=1 Tax=Aestuariibius violaceus TaxID=3234132 RepID=UPI00345F156A